MEKLHIPGLLVHKIGQKTYRLNGIIESINESNDTCTMRFRGNILEKDIPMSKVLINEGFLDKLKEYGKKITSFVVKKVKGFIAAVDEKTGEILKWTLSNIANLSINYSKGNAPAGFSMAVNNQLAEFAGLSNYKTFDDIINEANLKDSREANIYFKRIMNRAGTTNESIEESVKYVNETYYRPVKSKKAINEAIYSYDPEELRLGKGKISAFGPTVTARKLKQLIRRNIKTQISGFKDKYLLIWGAPGIGKTAIITNALKEMAESKVGSILLNLIDINLSTASIESFSLPKDKETLRNGEVLNLFSNTPPAWLPVYEVSPDPKVNKKRDEIYNSCAFLSSDESGEIRDEYGNLKEYQGGVLFFDEFGRVNKKVNDVLMKLSSDRKFGENYKLASKWAIIFASNTSFDEGEIDTDNQIIYPSEANRSRYIHLFYKPTKEEWLEWAREINSEGEANVIPEICDFIEASPDYVWYSTIANGGYDDMLDNPNLDKKAHEDADPGERIQDVMSQIVSKSKRGINPRDWGTFSMAGYKSMLIEILDNNKDGIPGREYYKQLVKASKVSKTDENGKQYTDYYGGILPNLLIDALNNVDDEYWNYWVEENLWEYNIKFKGKTARYEAFQLWFKDYIKNESSDDSGTNVYDAKSPLFKSWREYDNFSKSMTKEVYDSIWATGKVPKPMQDDDNYTPINISDFKQTTGFKWKQYTPLVQRVISLLWESYPGSMTEDIQEAPELIRNAPALSDKDVIEKAKQLNDKYAININNKSVKLLYTDNDLKTPDIIRPSVINLLQVPFVQRMTNFALYITKLAIQTQQSSYAYEQQKDLQNYFSNTNNFDDETKEICLNNHNYGTARALYNREKTDANKKAYEIELNKILILPAFKILSGCRRYFSNKV